MLWDAAEGTKATIYVGPGPLVPVEVTSDGTEIAKMGVPEGAKEVVAKSIKKDSNDDDKNGPSAPPPSASSGVSRPTSAWLSLASQQGVVCLVA